MNSITYLLSLIQFLYQQNCWLVNFICKYIPLKQWAFDDSHSPKYQKLKTDDLSRIQFHQSDWDWQFLIPYLEYKYHNKIRPVARHKKCDISPDCSCPRCHAPQPYLYRNNDSKGQLRCKVCNTNFSPDYVKRTAEYRSTKCEDMPRKPLDISFTDYPVQQKRGQVRPFPAFWRGRVRAEPVKGSRDRSLAGF